MGGKKNKILSSAGNMLIVYSLMLILIDVIFGFRLFSGITIISCIFLCVTLLLKNKNKNLIGAGLIVNGVFFLLQGLFNPVFKFSTSLSLINITLFLFYVLLGINIFITKLPRTGKKVFYAFECLLAVVAVILYVQGSENLVFNHYGQSIAFANDLVFAGFLCAHFLQVLMLFSINIFLSTAVSDSYLCENECTLNLFTKISAILVPVGEVISAIALLVLFFKDKLEFLDVQNLKLAFLGLKIITALPLILLAVSLVFVKPRGCTLSLMKEIEKDKEKEFLKDKEQKNKLSKSYKGYIDPVKNTVFAVLFFLIWLPCWIYRTTDFLNKEENGEYRKPGSKVALCIFIPFYFIYWVAKEGARLDNLANKTNTDKLKLSPLYIISSFCPILLLAFMQNRINEICINHFETKEREIRETLSEEGEKPAENLQNASENENIVSKKPEMNEDYSRKIGLLKNTLMTLFFPLIWIPMWVHKTTYFLNKKENKCYFSPAKKTLLCMFVPLYLIYWLGITGTRTDVLSNEKELDTNTMAPSYVLLAFCPVVAMNLVQSRINDLCTLCFKEEKPVQQEMQENIPAFENNEEIKVEKQEISANLIEKEEKTSTPEVLKDEGKKEKSVIVNELPTQKTSSDEIDFDGLRVLKRLLDAEIITEEEFNQKKNEILRIK